MNKWVVLENKMLDQKSFHTDWFCLHRKLAKKRKETLNSRQEMTLMVHSSQHTTVVDSHALNGHGEYMTPAHTFAPAVSYARVLTIECNQKICRSAPTRFGRENLIHET